MFISTIIVILTYFIGIPFIQYMRYEKLHRHLQKSPDREERKFPLKGKFIALWYFILNILFTGTFSLLTLGLLSALLGLVIADPTTAIMAVFFAGAGIVFILMIIVGVLVLMFERRWQTTYNSHIQWHHKNLG